MTSRAIGKRYLENLKTLLKKESTQMATPMFSHSEKSVTTGVETFTPEAAHNALEQSDFVNREPSRRAVWKYADAMARGQWTIGQPIMFDDRGNLIDGKHRMLAVIKSGYPQTFTVIRGVPRSVVPHIDVGTPRKVTHLLKMSGVKNTAVVATMTRVIVTMERGIPDPSRAGNCDHPPTVDDLVNRAIEDDLINEIASEISGNMKFLSRMIGSSGFTGWFLYCLRAGLTERLSISHDFLGILKGDRVAATANDPAHLLRERLTRPEGPMNKTPSIVRLALTVKAWNAFAKSQTLTTIIYRSVGSAAESFPRPVLDHPVPAAGKE